MAQNEDFMKGDPHMFAGEMKKLINNKDMSDIRFVIGPTRKAIYAHRCVLSARCDVFRAMFADQSHKHKDGEVPFVLSDMTADVFLPLLEYIYTNCVTLTSKNAVDILGCAIEYGLDGLRKLCVEYLIDTLCVANAAEAMQAAVTFGQDELRTHAMEYIESNTEKVFQTKGFHEMSDVALASLLQSNELDIDELDVMSAIREWATVNSVVMGKSIQQVCRKVSPHIRLPLISPEETKVVEDDNKKDKMLSVDQIAFAWKFHALKQSDPDDLRTTKRKGTKPRDSHKGLKDL